MGFLAFWLGLIAVVVLTACVILAHEHAIYYTGVA